MNNIIKLILAFVFICLTLNSQAQDKKTIAEGISISNFEVDNISDEEVKVTVDYSYVGQTGSEFLIYAFPLDAEGKSMSRNINTKLIPLKTGNNHVSFTIKKRLKIDEFISKSIKICMFDVKRKIYCQEFSYTNLWKESSASVKIISFDSNKTNVNISEPVTLTWQTENANTIHILEKNTENISKVEASGAMTVMPDKTTTYILMVGKSSKSGPVKPEMKSITITINSSPKILTFRIEPQNINKGDRVRFYWEVKNAERVLLYDSYGEIMTAIELPNGALGWPHNLNGAYMENLSKSETYILKAINNIGEVEKMFKVTVKGKRID